MINKKGFCGLVILAFLLIKCNPDSHLKCNPDSHSTNRVTNFFDKDSDMIVLPVKLDNGLIADLVLDTGGFWGTIKLDSAYCAENHLLAWSSEPDEVLITRSSAWTPEATKRHLKKYNKPITINICNTDLEFDAFHIFNMKYGDFPTHLDGIFLFKKDGVSHVWEINFENNYLELHSAEDFKMPKKCYLFPMVEGSRPNSLYIQFPMTIKSADGDTLTINQPYLIDTGLIQDLVILQPAEELDFFRKKEADLLIKFYEGFQSRYNVSAKVFDKMEIDSMQIYTLEDPKALWTKYVIGLNFLKRFNVFLDLKNQQVGLQPIKNFKRTPNHYEQQFYFSVRHTTDGRQFVEMMADTKNNYYKEAGLKEGDEILSVNGYDIKDMTSEVATEIRNSNTKIIDIIRDGVPLKITVHIGTR